MLLVPIINGCGMRWLRWLIAAERLCAGCRRVLRSFAWGRGRGRRGKSSRIWVICCIGRLTQAKGKPAWHNSAVLSWEEGSARFFAALQELDDYLASNETIGCTPQKMFQGAIADSLTHVGQLAILRGLAGAPVRGENYAQADIVVGRVGAEQSAPRAEFD